MSLGSQVRRYREKLELTLEQLSELSDVDVGTISALEVRDSQKSKFASQLARAVGLSLEQLLDEGTDYPASRVPRYQGAAPGGLQSAIFEIRSPGNSYYWPFQQVSKADWSSLTDSQRSQVEGFVMGLLASSKQSAAGAL